MMFICFSLVFQVNDVVIMFDQQKQRSRGMFFFVSGFNMMKDNTWVLFHLLPRRDIFTSICLILESLPTNRCSTFLNRVREAKVKIDRPLVIHHTMATGT